VLPRRAAARGGGERDGTEERNPADTALHSQFDAPIASVAASDPAWTSESSDAIVIGAAAYERPREFAIRTLSGPTPLVYRYAFSPSDGGTLVELDAQVALPGAAALVGPLARRAIKRGVDDNFATLKNDRGDFAAVPGSVHAWTRVTALLPSVRLGGRFSDPGYRSTMMNWPIIPLSSC
jgi:hypothetical protein